MSIAKPISVDFAQRFGVAVSGELMMTMYPLMMSSDQKEITEAKTEIWDILSRIENILPGNGYFSKNGFSLVDAAFAPALMRLLMIRSLREDSHWKSLPKARRWADTVLALPEVRESVVPNFKEKFMSFLKERESPLVSELS